MAEIWELDADAPLIGPCTDTDDALHLIGSGTARFMGNDNDLFGSGTRGNAFGNRGVLNLVDDAGNRFATRGGSTSTAGATPRRAESPPAWSIDPAFGSTELIRRPLVAR